MSHLVLSHFHRYPQMQIEDCTKLLYQSKFGGGHFVSDPEKSLARLREEHARCRDESALLFEPLGRRFCRMNICCVCRKDLSLAAINRMFIVSSQAPTSSVAELEEDLADLGEMIRSGILPFSYEAYESFLEEYKNAGYPALSHSSAYKEAYHPAYRVMERCYQYYYPAICAIDRQLQKSGSAIIAIDGGSGTGKSTLAQKLSEIFPASVVHMDDFFLQNFQRTPERLSEPGGNVDYERFEKQVVSKLDKKASFSYDVFDCAKGSLCGKRKIAPNPLLIVEGAYAMHPRWSTDLFDLSIFLSADLSTRLTRIETRNGSFMRKRFESEWIPKENRYFSTFSVPEKASLILDTSAL